MKHPEVTPELEAAQKVCIACGAAADEISYRRVLNHKGEDVTETDPNSAQCNECRALTSGATCCNGCDRPEGIVGALLKRSSGPAGRFCGDCIASMDEHETLTETPTWKVGERIVLSQDESTRPCEGRLTEVIDVDQMMVKPDDGFEDTEQLCWTYGVRYFDNGETDTIVGREVKEA